LSLLRINVRNTLLVSFGFIFFFFDFLVKSHLRYFQIFFVFSVHEFLQQRGMHNQFLRRHCLGTRIGGGVVYVGHSRWLLLSIMIAQEATECATGLNIIFDNGTVTTSVREKLVLQE